VSKTCIVIRAAIRTSRGRTLAATALATAASFGVLELRLDSAFVNVVAYLTFLLAATTGIGTTISAVMKTVAGTRFALSFGAACAAPASGALAMGSHSFLRTAVLPDIRAARPETFRTLAEIAAAMTFALAVEMRVMRKMPQDYEQQRRTTLGWMCIGGGILTTVCAIVGALDPVPVSGQSINDSIASLVGAAAFGTFVLTALVVVLAAIPRNGFEGAVEHEEQALRASGLRSRHRTTSAQTYAIYALPTTIVAGGLMAGAVEVSWIAFLALICSAAWLWHAWRARDRAPRADGEVPLHPVTFIATVVAGIALACVTHYVLPWASHDRTTTELYPLSLSLLGPGYVVFATGHPRERRTGLLPSVHTVGVWCGIAAWAGLGLACCVVATAYGGGWFTLWTAMLCILPMLAQISYAISPALRRVPVRIGTAS
jgi:hypothetical protein